MATWTVIALSLLLFNINNNNIIIISLSLASLTVILYGDNGKEGNLLVWIQADVLYSTYLGDGGTRQRKCKSRLGIRDLSGATFTLIHRYLPYISDDREKTGTCFDDFDDGG